MGDEIPINQESPIVEARPRREESMHFPVKLGHSVEIARHEEVESTRRNESSLDLSSDHLPIDQRSADPPFLFVSTGENKRDRPTKRMIVEVTIEIVPPEVVEVEIKFCITIPAGHVTRDLSTEQILDTLIAIDHPIGKPLLNFSE